MFASRLHLNRLTIIVFLFALPGSMVPARANQNRVVHPLERTQLPMTVQADSMIFLDRKDKVIFNGSVVVVQGDFTLKTDHLEMMLADKGKKPEGTSHQPGLSLDGREISFMTANGNVDIRQGNQRARADHAIYHKASSLVELSGKPEAWQGDTYLTGTKISLWLNENRSTVVNGRVIFHPKKNHDAEGAESNALGSDLRP
jgi:lipopolysaccharide transport protein LptA